MEFEKIYPHTENLESGIHPETIMIILTLKSVWIVVETAGGLFEPQCPWSAF
jgi:hypothetical protein